MTIDKSKEQYEAQIKQLEYNLQNALDEVERIRESYSEKMSDMGYEIQSARDEADGFRYDFESAQIRIGELEDRVEKLESDVADAYLVKTK